MESTQSKPKGIGIAFLRLIFVNAADTNAVKADINTKYSAIEEFFIEKIALVKVQYLLEPFLLVKV